MAEMGAKNGPSPSDQITEIQTLVDVIDRAFASMLTRGNDSDGTVAPIFRRVATVPDIWSV